MNNEMAYLLGMITGNGEIQRSLTETTISIDVPHKKLETEFQKDVGIYVKASITDIRQILEPLLWLEQYLKDKYKGYEIITLDTSQERLDRALKRYDIINDMATGVDIQIDVLGIARKKNNVKLFFIEAKKTKLTLRDLGQLWAYCKLIDPEEAFLFSSAGLGSLNKLVQSFRREPPEKRNIKTLQI